MENKLKILISNSAYEALLQLLTQHKEYQGLRLAPGNPSCCGKTTIHLSFDNKQPQDIEDHIEALPILYPPALLDTVKEITIQYKKDAFYMKTLPLHPPTGCGGSCKGKKEQSQGCHGCSGCGNRP